MKTLRILGTRGVPAAHGGFETFAEHLSLHLVGRGWRVVVYCQEQGQGETVHDTWQGVERVRIPVSGDGSFSTVAFDWLSVRHAARHTDLCLTLGYNTAVFDVLLRSRGIPNIMNMDGIEWTRAKWGPAAKAWFWFNDWVGCLVANHLVADHPAIKAHLTTRVSEAKIAMIPYGAVPIQHASEDEVRRLGLEPGQYLTVIARPEPENSVLEIVQAFSKSRRGVRLVVIGNYRPQSCSYHRRVLAEASDEVVFPGAIYEPEVLGALRFHCMAYVHGHQVGGTNPSLVEALGAGNPVIAHDNQFNRWVAGESALYFDSVDALARLFDTVCTDPARLKLLRQASHQRFREELNWPSVLHEYEILLENFLPKPDRKPLANPVAPRANASSGVHWK